MIDGLAVVIVFLLAAIVLGAHWRIDILDARVERLEDKLRGD